MVTIRVPIAPPSVNELRRKYKNPHAYRRLRDLWEEELYHALCARHRNELIDFARSCKMKITVHMGLKLLRDDDNLRGSLKPVLDALKNVGYIHNDSPEWLETVSVTQEMNAAKTNGPTKITLEPIHKTEHDFPLKSAA